MKIHVFSPIRGDLSLRIFDMTGRLVHSEFVSGLVKGSSITTLSKALPAGAYHLDWNIYADSITKAGNVKFNVFK
jgi:methionine-rich copper-binding protein CopC